MNRIKMFQTWVKLIILLIKFNISCVRQSEFMFHVKVKQGGWINWKYWKWFKLYKIIQCVYKLILFFRLIILSYWIKKNYPPEWIVNWDPFFGSLMFLYEFFDIYITIAFIPVVWLMFGYDYLYYFKTEKRVISIIYEFSIINQKNFIQLKTRTSQKNILGFRVKFRKYFRYKILFFNICLNGLTV